MSINIDYQPTEYGAIFWRSIVGTWVRTDWYDNLNFCTTGE